jgi:hypothetical protein
MNYCLFVLLLLFVSIEANIFTFFESVWKGETTAWNDLKRTWGVNPFGNNFVSLPRTQKEATSSGWYLDKNCSQINGNRYTLNGDRSVMLIYSSNGNIAGIAAGIPKNLPFNFPSDKIKPFFADEGSFSFLF